MDSYLRTIEGRIDQLVGRLYQAYFQDLMPLKVMYHPTPEPLSFREAKTVKYKAIKVGTAWGKLHDCAWFRFEGRVPASHKGKDVVALIDIGGEGCLYDSKGVPAQGLTSRGHEGNPDFIKRRIHLFKRAHGGEAVKLMVDAGANWLWGKPLGHTDPMGEACAVLKQADLAVFDREAYALYQDYSFLVHLMKALPEQSRHRKVLRAALNEVANQYGDGLSEQVHACRKILEPELKKPANASAIKSSAVGHAHIDLAWLWPLRETWRKCERTFSTALAMMEEYPEYVFGSSQPYLYWIIKQRHPEIYRRIKRAVAAGRWEIQGCMWVEADCNITSGESLIRQILHGQRFWREEFGSTVNNLWIPDVFGYCASLPQILKKSGVDYFVTQKMSWNQFNVFPHNTMWWRGLDGSQVFTHFPPADTYNHSCHPGGLMAEETNNKTADRCDHSLVLFGIGDGGGGPGRIHLERLRRAANIEDVPKVKQEHAADFFRKAARNARDLPVWEGELYLELHRGTLTTHARMKRRNRKLEFLFREVENLYALYDRAKYPKKDVDALWKRLLLHQFHDVIPGSSITRVYEEAHADYDGIEKELHRLRDRAAERYTRGIDTAGRKNPVVVQNSLSWGRLGLVRLKGDLAGKALRDEHGYALPVQKIREEGRTWTLVQVPAPACGHMVVSESEEKAPRYANQLRVSRRRLENECYIIEFDPDGPISRLYDKENDREVLPPRERANVFALYEDRPINYDAWDIDHFYAQTSPSSPALKKVTVLEKGPVRAALRFEYQDKNYAVVQDVSVVSGSRRIDFRTRVDWHESRKLLKALFPVAVRAQEASFEIQYGHVKRPTHENTSWDVARFEVLGHKWVDLSQRDYGVALLNDCKYGHRVRDNIIKLSLLRSPKSPDPMADMHEHEFTYSLVPHAGDLVSGRVIQEGYELNVPLAALPTTAGRGSLPAAYSAIRLEDDNVILETVKCAEDGDELVLRLYEATGSIRKTRLHFGFDIACAEEVNVMEEKPRRLRMKGRELPLTFQPFAIRTLRLKPA